MKRTLLFIAMTLILVMLTGCWGSDAKPGTIALTTAIDETGQPIQTVTRFAPGDTVTLALELVEAYEGLEIQVRWMRDDDAQAKEALKEETLRAPRAVDSLDPLWLCAKFETGTDWPTGTYSCQVFIPDQGTTTLTFTLE